MTNVIIILHARREKYFKLDQISMFQHSNSCLRQLENLKSSLEWSVLYLEILFRICR